MSYSILERVLYLMSFYIGPIMLVLLNWKRLKDPLRSIPKSIVIVCSLTVLHWCGLVLIGYHQWTAGCPTLPGDCYTKNFNPDVYIVKPLIGLSSMFTNMFSLIMIFVSVFRYIRNKRPIP
ncbi:MAG: hypothetical protein A3K90_04090 [Pelodictyon luteolum]|uniref:Uncharacterized protein n=1 Tax=Pelodictyon luteolum TaxID=1100 RepID=A0A165MBB5_PELLU|nr:MAG: hypothetical protein A3K90_04090 [Pelodictyon luteolum]